MREQDFQLHVKVVGWLHVFEAALFIGGALITMVFFYGIGLATEDPTAFGILSVVGFVCGGMLVIFGIPSAMAGWGLLTRRSWSRVLALVLAIFGLLLVPIGTLVGIYVLWVLLSDRAAPYFGDVDMPSDPNESAPVQV